MSKARERLSLSRARKVVLLLGPPWPPFPPFACSRRRKRFATVPVLLYRRSKMDTYHYVTTHYTPIGRLTSCPPFPRSYGIHGHRPTRLSDVMSPCIRCSPSWKVLRPSTSGNSSCWTIHIRLTPYIPPNQTTGMLVLTMSARRLSVLAIYDSHRMMGQ